MKTFLARFPIAYKLFAASAVFSAPITLLLVFMVWQFNGRIATAQREIEGTRRLDPLHRIAVDLRLHQRLSDLRLKGDLRWEAQREEAARRIDAILPGAGMPALAARWAQLRAAPPATPAENAAAYQRLFAEVANVAQETGDASALVLDPELDSHYLAQLVVVLVPQAQETVGDGILLADEAALVTQVSERDAVRLAVYADRLDGPLLSRVQEAAETALRATGNSGAASQSLQQNLPGLLSRYRADVTSYAAAMRQYSPATDLAALGARAEQTGDELWQTGNSELRVLLDRRVSRLRWLRTGALLLGLLAMVVAGTVQTVVSFSITRPLGEIVKLAADVAAGRLKAAREGLQNETVRKMLAFRGARDEMYLVVRAISDMTASLDGLLAQVGRSGGQVAVSATRMAAAIRQMEGAVSQQAASANQVNSTSKEIFASVQELARTMAQVSRVAMEAAESASGGVGNLDRIHATMRSLLTAGEGLSATLDTVAEKARNVDEVITAITKVANRTNLLSLNAAIEAERAGDSAGGFSVVALEIRRLADQTAVAALDIEKLVQEMQGAVREGVAGVDRYTAGMRASSGAVDALSEGLGHVIDKTRKLGPDFETVNQGMQLQSQGAGQIAESMTHLRDAAQQTRESLAEFRGVAEQLHEALDALLAEVGRFSAAGG
jgi:methyl-accepting chemotaxis protein